VSAILIITRLTFREAVRRRIVLAALLLGIAFLTIYSLGFYFVHAEMREPGDSGPMPAIRREQALNFFLMAGLYAANFLGIAMAALVTADTLAGEIASGTVQTLATKPVRRSDLVLGKWLGLTGLLVLYGMLMVGGVMASVYLQSGYHAPHLARGMGLIFLNSLLMMSVTLACSSSLSTLATGGVVFGLYGVAFVGGWVEQIGAVLQNQTAIKVGILSSLILPSEALWKRAAHEMSPPLAQIFFGSPFSPFSVPSPLMVAYACAYLAAALLLALRWFGRRDL
jgi:ABC-type transport system involved in multi-copper enzyme maturation permease subunit